MIVVHIESGLGNQMLSYGEYLILKKLHPQEDIYIENIVYNIPQAREVINQWNGYELEQIFGIHAPNVCNLFSESQWTKIMSDVIASKFWLKNWNYPVYITKALNNAGLHIKNLLPNFEAVGAIKNVNMLDDSKPSLKQKLIDTRLGNNLRRIYRLACMEKFIRRDAHYDDMFYKGSDSVYTGFWLGLRMRGSGIEFIDSELHEAFRFPEWDTEKNKTMANMLDTANSVAIHARRGDMLGANGYCYKYGYFRRAVKYIKERVENPVFVFFCDPNSIEWCHENESIFNLDYKKDKVYFVDWNKGNNSFRDMQLITHCKHAIITNSSFGWWGAYLISNPNKITISPIEEIALNTTYHC